MYIKKIRFFFTLFQISDWCKLEKYIKFVFKLN